MNVGSILRNAFLKLVALWIGAGSFQAADLESRAELRSDHLVAVVVDNEAVPPEHAAGYNGLAELSIAGGGGNLFVPRYAGLNLEHVFSGDAESFGWNIFEPRRAPMRLARVSDRMIELRQERTEHWPLRSRIRSEIDGGAVNFTYCGVPLADLWKKHGYIGVFFASYIQKPEDMSIEFIGKSRHGQGGQTPRWIKHVPPSHGVAANHRPAGSQWDPAFDEGFNIPLAQGASDLEYLYPFYFGRRGENVFVMMFERPRVDGEIRFAQSPSGGGTGNPAWDFMWLQRRYAVNQEFCFRGRAVLRKFTNRAEIVRLYEEWSGEKVSAIAAE